MTFRAGDLEVAYRMDGPGSAPVILLAHGILATHRIWDGVVSELANEWRVLRYDLRGHGATSASRAPYTIAQLAEDAVALLDALDIEQAHFIGSSLGGMIGQVLGARHGERLRSLTLANTTCVQSTPEAWADRIAIAQAKGVHTLAGPTLQRWFTGGFTESNPELIGRVRDDAANTSLEGFVGCASALRSLSQRELLPQIAVPTLVIAGEADTATPPSDAQMLHDGIRGSRLVILPAAHQSAAECPQAFATAWTAFLKQLN